MPVEMSLAVPAQNARELDSLRKAGAGEVYCGIMDHPWQREYGNHDSISRRQGLANIQDWPVLRELVAEARGVGLPVFLTLNARYTPPQYPQLVQIARRFEAMGGTGLHVSDIGLMLHLNQAEVRLKRSMSLLAVCTNRNTAKLWVDLGATRIVFPRSMTPREMGEILNGVPGIEGEAMVMGDKCPFIDGLCRCYHGVGYVANPTGEKSRRVRATFDTTFSTMACQAWGLRSEAMPCAACKAGQLTGSGISVGKIGGRGTPLAYRLTMLRFMRAALAAPDHESRAALYHEFFRTACCCYYEGTGV